MDLNPRTLLPLLALLSAPALALPPPQPVAPFDLIGPLQAATLGGTDPLAGGTLTVQGQQVTIPRNTVVLLPATALTWQELFALAPPPYGPAQTGLALGDLPAPTTSWQVHVTGNRVGDQFIAGLVSIAQDALNTGQGWINAIDYATGELRVGGTMGSPSTGQRVRLNDPIGRFGRAASPDVRFTIDEENPTVRAATGYPLCIPRTDPASTDDPLCPQGNRPRDPATGGYAQVFHTPDPALGLLPDARRAAPLQVGDFVTYSGVLVKDGGAPTAGPFPGVAASYVSAYSVVANLGIFTAYGADPVYVAIDVTVLGVGGTPIAGIPQEATARTVFEGFTTDPSRSIDLYAIDVDPCTGATSDRSWGSVAVDPGPPIGAVLGRWRFRPPTKVLAMPLTGAFLPATREVRARVFGAAPTLTTNGLLAGQYHAPITDYLFPENLAVGGPVVPLNFAEFPFLASGSGPWAGGGPSPIPGGVVGQLSPWPGSPVPTAPSCAGVAARPPTANAGPSQTVVSGALVALDGSGSTSPSSQSLTWAWRQTSGPSVTLSGSATARPTFTAPPVVSGATPATLIFSLTVRDGAGSSSPSTVAIVVNPAPTAPLAPVANAGPAQAVRSGATVILDGRASFDPQGLSLAYAWTQLSGPKVTLTGANTASPAFTAPNVGQGSGPSTLLFGLTVSNGFLTSTQAQVTVTVQAFPDLITFTLIEYRTSRQRLTINASSSVTSGAAVLTATIPNHAPAVMTNLGRGNYSLVLVGVPAPFEVSVTSSLGGSATSGVTSFKP
jgi:hypothetical protein